MPAITFKIFRGTIKEGTYQDYSIDTVDDTLVSL